MTKKKERTTYQERREATYEDLVRGAIESFYVKGYAGSRVEDIAEAAGHKLGGFYFHFKNKVECFFAVEEYRRKQREGWQSLLDDFDPATHSLEIVIVAVLSDLDRRLDGKDGWTLVMADFARRHYDDPELVAKIRAIYETWRDEIATFLVMLSERGWLAPHIDADVLATEVLAYAEAMVIQTRLFGLDQEPMRRVMLAGLLRLLGEDLSGDIRRTATQEATTTKTA